MTRTSLGSQYRAATPARSWRLDKRPTLIADTLQPANRFAARFGLGLGIGFRLIRSHLHLRQQL